MKFNKTREITMKFAYVSVSVLAMSQAAFADTTVKKGDVTITISGAMTVGEDIRSTSPNPAFLPTGDAASIGLVGTAIKGMNQADGDLNYRQGQAVSSVVKGLIGADIHTADFGVKVSAKAWYDWALADGNVAFGNIPNGYTAGASLDEAGWDNQAKSSSISLLDAYIYGHYKFGGITGEARVGNQTVLWGLNTKIAGGMLTSINGIDLNAVYRPGAQQEELLNRSETFYNKVNLTKSLSLEGFLRASPSINTPLGCGTYFAQADYIQQGCNYVLAGPSTMTDAHRMRRI